LVCNVVPRTWSGDEVSLDSVVTESVGEKDPEFHP
jgi:hypothetical protein